MSRTTVPTSNSPILIGGQRRSGTTLMRSILDRHPDIASLPECHFFQHVDFRTFFKTLLADYHDVFERLNVGQSEMDFAVANFIDTLFGPRKFKEGAQRWLEKSPENIRRIDYLFRLFPDAQFIHMIRDPRDTLASMKQQAATYKPYWAKFTAEVTAPEWVKCIESGQRWRDHSQQYIEVRYEKLVADPKAELLRVLEFLNEPWNDGLLEAHGTTEGPKGGNDHRPVFSTSVSRWFQDLSPEELETIEIVAGETMRQFGYPLATN